MISTVVTSTITTITTMLGFGVTLGLVAVVALAAFLCARELAVANNGSTQRFLGSSLDVSIVPLIIAFVMIVAMKVVEIIG